MWSTRFASRSTIMSSTTRLVERTLIQPGNQPVFLIWVTLRHNVILVSSSLQSISMDLRPTNNFALIAKYSAIWLPVTTGLESRKISHTCHVLGIKSKIVKELRYLALGDYVGGIVRLDHIVALVRPAAASAWAPQSIETAAECWDDEASPLVEAPSNHEQGP
jgi:hypothetical protein